MRDIGVEVEGAIGRREPVEARLRQVRQQQVAVAAVTADMSVELVGAIEGGKAAMLARSAAK